MAAPAQPAGQHGERGVAGHEPGDQEDGPARAARQAAEHLIERFAADVVEVDVDAVRSMSAQIRAQLAALIVDRGVEPELLDQPRALLRAAGDPHGPAALDPRYLAGHAPHG